VTNRADVQFEWIGSTHELTQFVEYALGFDEYFLDTEFHREKTYFPRLALIQIAVGDRLALIDPISCDTSALQPLLEGTGTCILHAAQQDLDVMAQSCGFIPARIFDTQIAAGFIGYSTPSLASLLASFLKVIVPKGDRLTDWLRRPLTADQLSYAASDVAYLKELRDLIQHQLQERGRLQWALDACEELRTRPTGPAPQEDAWLRVKDVRTLKGRSRWVCRHVAMWREQRAAELDIPVRHVLSDIAVLGIAQRAPRSTDDLLQCRGVDGRHVSGKHGRDLLDSVARGVEAASQGDLQFPSSDADDLEKSMRPAVTLVGAWVAELARQSDLDPALLGTRKDIVELLVSYPGARLAQGWRAEIVGDDIKALVEGHKALTFIGKPGDSGLKLVDVHP
jgi:ribonuclease D